MVLTLRLAILLAPHVRDENIQRVVSSMHTHVYSINGTNMSKKSLKLLCKFIIDLIMFNLKIETTLFCQYVAT